MRIRAIATEHRVAGALLAVLAGAGACGGQVSSQADPFGMLEDQQAGLPVLSLRWSFALADKGGEPKPQEFATPAVYAGSDELLLFIGSHEGVFYAISAADGRTVWKTQLGSVSSTPVADRGRIFVGTDDGFMVALDTSDGRELWRYATRGPILEAPVLAGDTLIFSNEAEQVYALERETGKFRWQYKAEEPEEYTLRGHAGVALGDGLVFSGFANGTVVALRANTGSVAWMTSLTGESDRFVDVDGTPVIVGDSLVVTSSSGGVYSMDKATGFVRWRTPIEGAGSLTIDGDRIYVAAAERGVYALDRNGNIIWRQGTRGGGEPAEPIVTGEYLVYTLSDAGVFIADKLSGEVHQYFDPGHGVSSQPAVRDDQMYVLSNRGVLYAMWLRRY